MKNLAFLIGEFPTKVSGGRFVIETVVCIKESFLHNLPYSPSLRHLNTLFGSEVIIIVVFYNFTWGWECSTILEQNPVSSKKMGWGI